MYISVKGLNQKCGFCGIALYDKEIDGEIMGEYIDYGRHIRGPLTMTFCSECWGRLVKNTETDQSDAIMKRKQLDRD